MKKIKFFLITILFLALLGCEDFVNKEPLDIISDALVWDDQNLVDSYLADLYFRADFSGVTNHYPENTNFALIPAMGGEATSYGAHHPPYYLSTAVLSVDYNQNLENFLGYWKWNSIRDCNFFLEKMQASSLDPDFVNQKVAEARFLRAYMYFQMVIRYGGVPIITEAISPDAPPEEIFVARDSEKAVYDFVINELTEIAQILPSQYEAQDKGRPSKWAALALQSRAALYAASIAKYGQVQLNGLLGFPASDIEHYAKISYDASKAIINNGIHFLYEVDSDPAANFQALFLDESAANTEVIMSEVFDYGNNRAHAYTLRATPHDHSNTFASMYYLYDFVERFEFADGRPGTSVSRAQLTSQEWSMAELFGNRDARFKASVFYPESPWRDGKTLFHSRTIRNGVTYTSGVAEDGWPYKAILRNTTKTGLMVRKRCNENLIPADVVNDYTDIIIFRLGEIYLNLAEAAYYRGYTSEALDALNRVRQRAAMPPKPEITEAILQNERLVELTFENHSYWDIRRWRTGVGLLNGVRLQGLDYTFNYDTKKYIIRLINGQGIARTFVERNYYLPIGLRRVAENPNFVENPGY